MISTPILRRLSMLALLVATPCAAQAPDAWVLPPGMGRLVGGAEFSRHEARFVDGGRGTLPPGILEPLTRARFAPLAAIEPELAAFFASTGNATGARPVTVGPETFLLGRLGGGATVSQRVIPLGVRLGVVPRVEVGVTVPVVRGEMLVPAAPLVDGTLGANPDPARNAQVLARAGARWRTLGGARFLPTDSSALGRELQRRVLALTGSRLELPDSTLRAAEFQQVLAEEFGLAPFASRNTPWQVGDVEVDARVQILSTLGRDAYPRDSTRAHFRLAVGAGARLPTGVRPDSVRLVDPLPEVGLSGGRLGVAADYFSATRLWLSAGAEVAVFGPVEVRRRLADPDAPFATAGGVRTVRWSPGRRLHAWVAPRLRLTEEIALAAEYTLRSAASSTFEVVGGDGDATVLDPEAHRSHAVGLSARYSTLPAYAAQRAPVAVEAEIGYLRAIAGSGGAPRASAVTARLSLFHPLWGRARSE